MRFYTFRVLVFFLFLTLSISSKGLFYNALADAESDCINDLKGIYSESDDGAGNRTSQCSNAQGVILSQGSVGVQSIPALDGGGNSTSQTQNISASKVNQLEDSYEESCQPYKKYASRCCTDPKSCLDTSDVDDDSELNVTGGAIAEKIITFQTIAAQTAGALTASGVSKMCESMKILNMSLVAVNIGLTTMCGRARDACDKKCGEVKDEAKQLLQGIGITVGTKRVDCESVLTTANAQTNPTQAQQTQYRHCQRLGEVVLDSRKRIRDCDNLSGKQAELVAANIIQGGMSQALLKCQEDATVASTGFEDLEPVAFNNDCTTLANASNPICIRCTANPEASGCENILTNNGTQSDSGHQVNFNDGDDGSGGLFGDDDIILGDIDGEMPEFSDLEGVEPSGQGSRSIAGGGGAGPGGGGSGGGISALGQAESGGRSPSSASGIDTDIIQGERSGGGFTSSSTGGSGGFGSYTGSGKTKDIDRKKGNIFDIMRKAAKGAKDKVFGKRLPANSKGLLAARQNRNKRGIGLKHENIFELVSNSYKLLCVEKGLFSCLPDYANFNYYKHSEWVRNSFLMNLKKCNRKCKNEKLYVSEILEREAFLHTHYKGKFKKLFNPQSYKKGAPVATVPGSCTSNNQSCQDKKYRRFVYVGPPQADPNKPPVRVSSKSSKSASRSK